MNETSIPPEWRSVQHREIRRDLLRIAELVTPSSRVLDAGCGDGSLLEFLVREKDVDGRGIEISQAGVHTCVSRGLSVIQGDVDFDLKDYPSNAFDFVVLSQTLQAMRRPLDVLDHLVRIGRCAIVSIPNFGSWRMRWLLVTTGRMPVTDALPYGWHDTPNIHFCTIRDFVVTCANRAITIEQAIVMDGRGKPLKMNADGSLANWLGEQAIFLLSRSNPRQP